MAVIPAISLPWGHRRFTSGAMDPVVKVAVAKDAPLGFSVSSNLNFASMSDEAGGVSQETVSLSVGHAIPWGMSAYGEVYTFSREEREGQRVTVLQAGVTRGFSDSAQWDISVARRVTAGGPDLMVSAGLVVRHRLGLGLRR